MKQQPSPPTIPRILLPLMLALAIATPALAKDRQDPVRIGVLAKRGPEKCLEKWSPTAGYLTSHIPGLSFTIVPLGFDDIDPAVERGEVDFMLSNPSFYVGLEKLHGANRIATLRNRRTAGVYTVYGGVIFRRADRDDVERLADLKGKTFMAVDEKSFGGWLTAWRELKEHGIDPHRDFADLQFGGTHDAVVYAVRDGKVDAGTVRTDTLERMALEGKIRLEDFHALEHDHIGEDVCEFPFLHSTDAYPEWPFAKLRHASDELAEKVALALLNMRADSPAAKAARCAGWTVPLNYQPVHECLKELRVAPYKDFGRVTLGDVIRHYWPWLVAATLLLAAAVATALYVLRLDRRASRGKLALGRELSEHRQAEAKFKTICASAQDAVIMMDGDGNISFWNDAAQSAFGYTPEDAIGKHLHAFLAPERFHEGHSRAFPRFQETGQGDAVGKTLELAGVRKNGEEFPIELSLSAVQISEQWEAIGIVRDITTRRQAEAQRLEALEVEQERNHLREAVKAFEQVLGVIGHELRTPLAGIRAMAEFLLREDAREAQEFDTFLGSINNEVVRMAGIVNDLVEVARLNSGTARWNWSEVSIAQSCQDALDSMDPLVDRATVKLTLEVEPPDLTMSGDADAVRRLVLNLLSNACKHTAEGSISARAGKVHTNNQDWVQLEVSDTGEGIPPDIADRLGVPFALNSGVFGACHVKGSGLGLAICKGIVAAHGGTICVRTAPGKGTTVTILLRRDLTEPASSNKENHILSEVL